ncbi:TolB family protein [Candidatus Leptofilum sp.]|uniref:TolB family protein n=1 Tax=Candidatus Leptofilum sp. TaxID=3241576 RepID=UPI003B5B2D78
MQENNSNSNKFSSTPTKWVVLSTALFFTFLIAYLVLSSTANLSLTSQSENEPASRPLILLYLKGDESQKQLHQYDFSNGSNLALDVFLQGESPDSLVWRDKNHVLFVSAQQDFIELNLESGKAIVLQSHQRSLFRKYRSMVGSLDWCSGIERFVVTGTGVSPDFGWVEILNSSGELDETVSNRSGYMDIACSPDSSSVAVVDTINSGGLVSVLGNTPLPQVTENEDIFLTIVSLADGESTRLTQDGFVIQPNWSPDGSQIAFVGQFKTDAYETQIYLINLDTKEREVLTSFEDANLATPVWSPDGKMIAFVKDGDIWLIQIETGEITQVTETPEEESAPVWHP